MPGLVSKQTSIPAQTRRLFVTGDQSAERRRRSADHPAAQRAYRRFVRQDASTERRCGAASATFVWALT